MSLGNEENRGEWERTGVSTCRDELDVVPKPSPTPPSFPTERVPPRTVTPSPLSRPSTTLHSPGSVTLDPLNVDGLSGLVSSSSSVIDGDSKSLRLLLSNTGSLELSEGETSSLSDLGVVPDGGASDGGSESLEGSGSEGGGLGGSGLSSSRLSSRLVEPGLHSSLWEWKARVVQKAG